MLVILLAYCKKQEAIDVPDKLKLLLQYQINIPELSGLSQFNVEDKFITVSDKQNKVYLISNTGEVLKILDYTGDDLEGVTFDTLTSTIFVVEEKKKEVVQLDSNGFELNRFTIDINNSEIKHGPEGITYNPYNNHFYIVNEKLPAALIEMTLTGEIVRINSLSFAKDYSSLFYDQKDSSLWILSDQSKTITKCDLNGNKIKTWSTGIDKGEGLIVDSGNSKIYIVTDNDSHLYIFSY
ncbi:MAG: SdiA-regulated domain-containing protein [Bacteroidales bacterium]|nr:SdiA-regulated domain-containing protein [Bacteroidales bacterium]